MELSQRAAALAAAALLTGVFGVALSQAGQSGAKETAPQPAVGAWGGWESAVVGVAAPVPRRGRRGDCGWFLSRTTLGVIHPVLPCGARLFLDYGGSQVLTRVVAHAPVAQSHEFDLTRALAFEIGFAGARELSWAYAR